MPRKIKTINIRQLRALYWPTWNAAAKVLKEQAGYTKEELESFRKETHRQVAGRDCSSKDLINRQLDECLKRWSAIGAPTDGKRQADLADQAATRVRYLIRQIQKNLGLSDGYIESMSLRMTRRSFLQADEAQLLSILKALRYHENRHPDQLGPQEGA